MSEIDNAPTMLSFSKDARILAIMSAAELKSGQHADVWKCAGLLRFLTHGIIFLS